MKLNKKQLSRLIKKSLLGEGYFGGDFSTNWDVLNVAAWYRYATSDNMSDDDNRRLGGVMANATSKALTGKDLNSNIEDSIAKGSKWVQNNQEEILDSSIALIKVTRLAQNIIKEGNKNPLNAVKKIMQLIPETGGFRYEITLDKLSVPDVEGLSIIPRGIIKLIENSKNIELDIYVKINYKYGIEFELANYRLAQIGINKFIYSLPDIKKACEESGIPEYLHDIITQVLSTDKVENKLAIKITNDKKSPEEESKNIFIRTYGATKKGIDITSSALKGKKSVTEEELNNEKSKILDKITNINIWDEIKKQENKVFDSVKKIGKLLMDEINKDPKLLLGLAIYDKLFDRNSIWNEKAIAIRNKAESKLFELLKKSLDESNISETLMIAIKDAMETKNNSPTVEYLLRNKKLL